MLRNIKEPIFLNLTNCFYCQGLKNPLKGGKYGVFPEGKCAFCGVYNNPLYLVIYENKERYFCCGCAWWQIPRSEEEKEAEEKWYREWKKELAEQLTKRHQKRVKNSKLSKF